MKKALIISITFLLSIFVISCNTDTTTITTTTLSIPDLVSSLDNPYNIGLFITEDPTSSIGVNFELSEETTAFVEYKTIEASEYTRITATNKTTTVGKATAYLYEADMTGLTEGVTYTYRIGTESQSILSSDYEFTMNSNSLDSFTFMYIADPQENTELGYMAYAYAILNVLDFSNSEYDFVMYPGDIVNDADIASEWDWFYQYSSFFITERPIIATIGNHEGSGIETERINNLEFDGFLNLPSNGPLYQAFDELEGDLRNSAFDDGKTFSFNYGNAHFIAVNTEMYCDGTTDCDAYDQSNAEILNQWIRDDLAASTAIWNVVLLHRGPYSLSYNTTSVRDNLVPIFEEYNVDLVLSGHDHQYSHAVYQSSVMVPFQSSNDYSLGTIFLTEDSSLSNHFNNYSSSLGVTYLTGNTVATKFYGGDKSSGIEVQYKFIDENPVIPFITITEDSIRVISYGVYKDSAYAIVPTGVYVLEEFTITK